MAKVGSGDEWGLRKKGGSMFPRIALEDAVQFSGTLHSMTYERPLQRDIVFPAVFNARSWLGSVRASALKQYGLMEGNVHGYQATNLAGAIASTSGEKRSSLLQRACLTPRVFERLSAAVDLFDGLTEERKIPLSVLHEAVVNLGVHPDSAQECVDIYVASLEFSGLAAQVGDFIRPATTKRSPECENLGLENADPNPLHRSALSEAKAAGARYDLAHGITIKIDGSLSPADLRRHIHILREEGLLG